MQFLPQRNCSHSNDSLLSSDILPWVQRKLGRLPLRTTHRAQGGYTDMSAKGSQGTGRSTKETNLCNLSGPSPGRCFRRLWSPGMRGVQRPLAALSLLQRPSRENHQILLNFSSLYEASKCNNYCMNYLIHTLANFLNKCLNAYLGESYFLFLIFRYSFFCSFTKPSTLYMQNLV